MTGGYTDTRTEKEKDREACKIYGVVAQDNIPDNVLRAIGYYTHSIWKRGRILKIVVRHYRVCSLSKIPMATVRIEYKEKRQRKPREEQLELERMGDTRWVCAKIGY